MKNACFKALPAILITGLLFSTGAHSANWTLDANGASFDYLHESTSLGNKTSNLTVTEAIEDLSGTGYVLRADSGESTLSSSGTVVSQSYQHLIAVDAGSTPGVVTVELSLSHALDAVAGSTPSSLWGTVLTQDLALSGLKLTVSGDAGEAPGSAVMVTFTGLASVLANPLPGASEMGLGLSFVGATGQVLASYDGYWTGSADQPITLSFGAVVGDVIELSLWGHHDATQGVGINLAAGGVYGASYTSVLSGQLSVSAVPEPDAAWLLLAGVCVVAFVSARMNHRSRG